jgi:hypothetical protein
MRSVYESGGLDDPSLCHLCFALGKASEDIGNYQEAFAFYERGNALRKKIISYDYSQDERIFSEIKRTDDAVQSVNGIEFSALKGPVPIFILGMPRSGTTLVEQIISSHSSVYGAGELPYISSFGLSVVRGFEEASGASLSDFRQRYIEKISEHNDGSSYVIDKMPHNFRAIGLILKAIPEAKIIHLSRDPGATCWSNYKHYFRDTGLGYSYNLDDLVRHYGLYTDLMNFWSKQFGDKIYHLNYEELTQNQEDETVKLVNYLGLSWQDGFLEPHKNERVALTASQQQVKKQVYTGSSEAWKKFEPYVGKYFKPLYEMQKV